MRKIIILASILFLSILPASAVNKLSADASSLPIRPDPKLTPGANDPSVVVQGLTKDVLCKPGYSSTVRNVPESLKRSIYKEYGIDPKQYPPASFEIDHLCSLELGCNNSPKNLWPQSYSTKPYNAKIKDALENKLHTLVCTGKLSVHDAQVAISTDWIAAHTKYVQ